MVIIKLSLVFIFMIGITSLLFGSVLYGKYHWYRKFKGGQWVFYKTHDIWIRESGSAWDLTNKKMITFSETIK